MQSTLIGGVANYQFFLKDSALEISSLIGRQIQINHTGKFFCLNHNGPIKKTFGEGLCWKCFNEAAAASPCIIHPELCKIHEGVALRGDLQWELENHMQEHVVYLSYTSGLKVGVTRSKNMLSRWIDQGARKAIVLARVPYRQLAGEIEVLLKEHVADKTNWKQMLQQSAVQIDLIKEREKAIDLIPEHYQDFVDFDSNQIEIQYPVLEYPINPKVLKLESTEYSGKLKGIVGQYLILENNLVFNVRSNSGLEIEFIIKE